MASGPTASGAVLLPVVYEIIGGIALQLQPGQAVGVVTEAAVFAGLATEGGESLQHMIAVGIAPFPQNMLERMRSFLAEFGCYRPTSNRAKPQRPEYECCASLSHRVASIREVRVGLYYSLE